jgi:chorismate dehydratase
MTGLPFVYAMWVGRPGAASPAQCRDLREARERGVAHLPEIARAVSSGNADLEARSLSYLRDYLRYGLGAAETEGLRRFHQLAAEVGVVDSARPLLFFPA